jgi:hypothetical protein
MATLSEAIRHLRADYCEGCNDQYSHEEILDGAFCAGCEHAKAVGRSVAHLRD